LFPNSFDCACPRLNHMNSSRGDSGTSTDESSASNVRIANISASTERASASASDQQVHIFLENHNTINVSTHRSAPNTLSFLFMQRGKRVSDAKQAVAAHTHPSLDGFSLANAKTGATQSSTVVASAAPQSMSQMAVPTVSSLSSSLSSSYSQPPLFTVTSVSVSTGPIKTAKPARSTTTAGAVVRPLQQPQQRQQQPPQPPSQQPQPLPPQPHASLNSSKTVPAPAAHVSAAGSSQTATSEKSIAGKNISGNSKLRSVFSAAVSTASASENAAGFSRGAADLSVETTVPSVCSFVIQLFRYCSRARTLYSPLYCHNRILFCLHCRLIRQPKANICPAVQSRQNLFRRSPKTLPFPLQAPARSPKVHSMQTLQLAMHCYPALRCNQRSIFWMIQCRLSWAAIKFRTPSQRHRTRANRLARLRIAIPAIRTALTPLQPSPRLKADRRPLSPSLKICRYSRNCRRRKCRARRSSLSKISVSGQSNPLKNPLGPALLRICRRGLLTRALMCPQTLHLCQRRAYRCGLVSSISLDSPSPALRNG
jgi:hypothetical protein